LARFSLANQNKGQPKFLTVLHVINSPSISFEDQPNHGSICRVKSIFKIIAFQIWCFQFSQYVGSWVWKVYIGLYCFVFLLHHLKLFILKKEFRLSGWPKFLLKSLFLSFFIWSFKIQFLLKLNCVFFLFYFLFDYLVCMILLMDFDYLT
jgi:hypothetical protein